MQLQDWKRKTPICREQDIRDKEKDEGVDDNKKDANIAVETNKNINDADSEHEDEEMEQDQINNTRKREYNSNHHFKIKDKSGNTINTNHNTQN